MPKIYMSRRKAIFVKLILFLPLCCIFTSFPFQDSYTSPVVIDNMYRFSKTTYSAKVDIYTLLNEKKESVNFNEFAKLLKDINFSNLIMNTLAESRFKTFFWEFIPLLSSKVDKSEVSFALVEAKALENINQDSQPFSKYISAARKRKESVAVFQNLGRDATLIVPVPSETNEDNGVYKHIASFARTGTETNHFSFLSALGDQLAFNIAMKNSSPLWISTSG